MIHLFLQILKKIFHFPLLMSDTRMLITLRIISVIYNALEIRKGCAVKVFTPDNVHIEMVI